MVDKKLGGAGLRGQSAGETSLCTVGVSGTGLTYRGYDITDLAENTTFEEVAYLIFYGHLPNASELAGYKQKLKENSCLLYTSPSPRDGLLSRMPSSA